MWIDLSRMNHVCMLLTDLTFIQQSKSYFFIISRMTCFLTHNIEFKLSKSTPFCLCIHVFTLFRMNGCLLFLVFLWWLLYMIYQIVSASSMCCYQLLYVIGFSEKSSTLSVCWQVRNKNMTCDPRLLLYWDYHMIHINTIATKGL